MGFSSPPHDYRKIPTFLARISQTTRDASVTLPSWSTSSAVFYRLAPVFGLNVTQPEPAVGAQADAEVKEFFADVTPAMVRIETLAAIGWP